MSLSLLKDYMVEDGLAVSHDARRSYHHSPLRSENGEPEGWGGGFPPVH